MTMPPHIGRKHADESPVKAMPKKCPLVVEMVGPAGAGKTTLIQTLCQHDQKIKTGIRIQNLDHISFVIRETLPLLPTYLRKYRHSRWFNRGDIRSMVYLQGWLQTLEKQPSDAGGSTAILLDHGPIFRLAYLYGFGPEITNCQQFKQWWDAMFCGWQATLNMVIWLDAPDKVLLHRVQNRSQQHVIKGESKQTAYVYLGHYRRLYQDIISGMTAGHELKVLHFDTSLKSTEQIADQVLAALHSTGSELLIQ